ncbi:cytochrome C [Roseibium sp. RKSG952]|nr:cytochrome C [Roseibium sp. RKSG952]
MSAVLVSGPALAQGSTPFPADDKTLAAGLEIAEIHCASCHAISTDDASAEEGAPPFRTLSQLYPLESLEESLAEGIVTGHEGMPEFAFAPEDIDAFLGYLSSIQIQK